MGRPKGSRNENYDAERARMARAVRDALIGDATMSARQLATACDVSPPTFRHYFGNRAGALRAALDVAAEDSVAHVEMAAEQELGPAAIAFRTLLSRLAEAWTLHDVGPMHHIGLHNSAVEDGVGTHYTEKLLEPFLQSFERRVELHASRGELDIAEPRSAALMLVAPIVLALLHQNQLGGADVRPVDFEELIDEVTARFMRAYRPLHRPRPAVPAHRERPAAEPATTSA